MAGKKESKKSEEQSGSIEKILELGAADIKNPRGNIYCLTIAGQIEGHTALPPQNKTTKYEHVIPQLISVEEDEKTDGLLALLNTVGGDVEAGLALAEMVASMDKPTVSLILGGGHSIGVPLAVAAKKSFIAPSATITLHPVRMSGQIIGVPQTFEYLNKMQDRVVDFIVRNSRIDAEKLRGHIFSTGSLLNDIGTILMGEEAVNAGIIDAVGGVNSALEALYQMISNEKHRQET